MNAVFAWAKASSRWLLTLLAVVPFFVSLTPASSAPVVFAFNWNGTPAGPQPWVPGAVNDWDLIVHNRDHQDSLQMVNAEHGPTCAPYPATHPVTSFQDSVFICNNHMMTALNGGGYSEIVMTPSRMLDFSTGGTVQVSISTAKLDNRDWLDFWISPFSENLLLPSGGIPPDLQGPTKDALLVNIDSSIPTTAHLQEFHNYVNTDYSGTGMSVEACVAPLGGVSTSRRDPFLLTLSRTHVELDVLVNGLPCALVNTSIADLGFNLGVVQLGHHSYSPDEGTACNLPGCTVNTNALGAGNTWHWSNFSMSPAVPFTMLRGDMALSGVQANTSPTVHFAGAAPANSFLRFSALARRGSVMISANGGPFFPAQLQQQHGDGNDGISDGGHIAYWTPIPAGTTIWSSDQAAVVPAPLPSPATSSNPAGGGTTGGVTTGGTGGATGDTGGLTSGTSGGANAGNPLEDTGGGGSEQGGTGETAGLPERGDEGKAREPESQVTLEGTVEAMVQRPVIPWAVAGLLVLATLAVVAAWRRRLIGVRRRVGTRSPKD